MLPLSPIEQSSERCEYMVFSSIEFLLFFLPLFLILYGLTPDKYKNVTLLAGSLIFYALGEPRFIFLLVLSVFINYFFGLHLGRRVKKKDKDNLQEIFDLDLEYNQRKLYKRRKRLFAGAIVLNLGLLCFFKYFAPGGRIPLGISFYTFQILSYIIDVYRGEERRETSFINFAAYVVMFPQLIMGPIVSYGEVRKNLRRREFTAAGLQEGLKVFTLGLAAKVLLADRIGLLWQEAQVAGFESISTPLAWLAAAAYSLKLYFDFYGYSLMASGLGRMLGFELPANFNHPYMAVSVRDFYRRWHMTLGRWFRRYVYIPLGGNRRGWLRTAGRSVDPDGAVAWRYPEFPFMGASSGGPDYSGAHACKASAARDPSPAGKVFGACLSAGGDSRHMDVFCHYRHWAAAGLFGQDVRDGVRCVCKSGRLAGGACGLRHFVCRWHFCLYAGSGENFYEDKGSSCGNGAAGGAVLGVCLALAG